MSCPCPRAVSLWRIWEFTKSGAEPGLLKPGLCQSHYTALPLPALKATCALGVLFVFVDHMHQWTFHHLHFTASQLRPILAGSDGTLHTHFSGCTFQGELHMSLPCPRSQPGQGRVQLNSQDCVKYKASRVVCWHQLSHSNVAWAPGKVGAQEVNSHCSSDKLVERLWRKIQGGKLGTRGKTKCIQGKSKESSMSQVWAITQCFTSIM